MSKLYFILSIFLCFFIIMLLLMQIGALPKFSYDNIKIFNKHKQKEIPQKSQLQDNIKLNIPTFLGGQTRSFYGKGPVPQKLDIIWKTYLGKGITKVFNEVKLWEGTGWTGQPVMIEEKNHPYLVIGSYDWNLRKINALNGNVVWTYRFDDVIKGSPSVFINENANSFMNQVVILQGSRMGVKNDFKSNIIPSYRAISFRTGQELWRLNIPKTESYSRDVDASGLIFNGLLYLGAENGIFYIINPSKISIKDGILQPEIIKSLKLYTKEDARGHKGNLVIEASPSYLNGKIYVSAGSGHIYAIDINTQNVVWDFYIGSDIDSTPAITNDGHIIVGVEKQYIKGNGGVFKLDPSKNPQDSVVWFFPTRSKPFADWQGGIIGSVSINDEYNQEGKKPAIAVFRAIDGYIYMVSQNDLANYKVLSPDKKKIYSAPKLIWKKKIKPSISTPIIVDDYIITAGYDAMVRIFKIDYIKANNDNDGAIADKSGLWKIVVNEVANFQAKGTFESTPIVWDGKIYIGCRDGYLYCLGDKQQGR